MAETERFRDSWISDGKSADPVKLAETDVLARDHCGSNRACASPGGRSKNSALSPHFPQIFGNRQAAGGMRGNSRDFDFQCRSSAAGQQLSTCRKDSPIKISRLGSASPSTRAHVKFHIGSILDKCGASTRTEAVSLKNSSRVDVDLSPFRRGHKEYSRWLELS